MTTQEKTKSWPLTLLVVAISIPLLLVLVYPVTGEVNKYLTSALGFESVNSLLVTDAIVSFAVLCLFFAILFLFKTAIYAPSAALLCAMFMFIYWGVESKFFLEGINPAFPLWYEINIAINDFVAALLIIFLTKRVTGKSSG